MRVRSAGKIIKHNAKRVRDKRADLRRGSARDRGYSTAWDKFARAYLRWHPLCLYCQNRGRVTAAVLVDHIEPHGGDPDLFMPPGDPDDHFASCCATCHNVGKQRAEATAAATGRPVRAVLVDMGMLVATAT